MPPGPPISVTSPGPAMTSDATLTLPLQADAIYDMIGFPDFILDNKELDDVYDGVSSPWQGV